MGQQDVRGRKNPGFCSAPSEGCLQCSVVEQGLWDEQSERDVMTTMKVF